MEETGASEGLEYGEQDGGYVVTGMGACKDPDVVIPAFHDGRRVTGVGDEAFSECRRIRSVAIPEGAERIGRGAFSGCRRLSRVFLPRGLMKIGDGAFADCGALRAVRLPDGLRYVGRDAFSLCGNLSCIVVPESIREIGADAFLAEIFFEDGGNDLRTPDVYYLGDFDGWLDVSGAYRFDEVFFYSPEKPESGGTYSWHWDGTGRPDIWDKRPRDVVRIEEACRAERERLGPEHFILVPIFPDDPGDPDGKG